MLVSSVLGAGLVLRAGVTTINMAFQPPCSMAKSNDRPRMRDYGAISGNSNLQIPVVKASCSRL